MAQNNQNMLDSSDARNVSFSSGGTPKISFDTVPPDSVPPLGGSITPPPRGDHEELSKEKSSARQLFVDNFNAGTGDGGVDIGGIPVSGSPNRGLKRARESGDSNLLQCHLCNRVFQWLGGEYIRRHEFTDLFVEINSTAEAPTSDGATGGQRRENKEAENRPWIPDFNEPLPSDEEE